MVQEILQRCTVHGTVVKLPTGKLERKLYMDVAKALTLIGGKWKGGKTMGFVFDTDPSELLQEIADGQPRNLKKEFQFFATPDDLANEMVRYWAALKPEHSILEPHGGNGALIRAIHRELPGHTVDYCELMDINRMKLDKIRNTRLICNDFLDMPDVPAYDRIIANPPFTKNQDIIHIRKMYSVLKPGGRIVTLASTHWTYSDGKKEKAFKEWLGDLEATVNTYHGGLFKESGTNIKVTLIVIDKI